MFITSIPQYQPRMTFKGEVETKATKAACDKLVPYILKPKSRDKIKWPADQKEKQLWQDTLKNLYRLMLSQDIWDSSLKVKWPETPEEKDTLLEILGFRAQLDRFVQLSHRRFNVMHDETISAENRTNTLNAINKKIDEEKKRHSEAFTFMEQLNDLDDEYIEGIERKDKKSKETEKHEPYIKLHRLTEFWNQIKNNNINSDGKMTVQDLIKCIESGEKPASVTASGKSTVQKQNSAKDIKTEETSVRVRITNAYEENLKKYIDVYSEDENATARSTAIARKRTLDENKELFKKHKYLKNILNDIYKDAEAEYKKNIDAAASSEMYPIGHIWQAMDEIENVAKETIKELKICESILAEKSDDKKAAKRADYLRKKLNNLKKEWLDGLAQSVQYEGENRARAAAAGTEKEYDYLVGQNANVIGQKSIMEELKSKYNDINDAPWTEIFSVFLN